MHVYSKIFQKKLRSWAGCFRRRQEPWGLVRCNPICHRKQDFQQSCDCCYQDKLQTHQWVNSPVSAAATADNHFSAAEMTCLSLGSSGISQKSSQTLLGLFQPISPPPWEAKEGRFLINMFSFYCPGSILDRSLEALMSHLV